jgi:hypothetical protein
LQFLSPLDWGLSGFSWDSIISRVTKVIHFKFPLGFDAQAYRRDERYKYAIKEEQRFFRENGQWTLVPVTKFEELARKKRVKRSTDIRIRENGQWKLVPQQRPKGRGLR